MKKNILVFSTALAIILSVAACTRATTAPPTPATLTPGATPETIAKETWEVEWGKTLREAKKEGKVSIYTDISAEIRSGIQKAFKEKFGIDAEFTVGSPAEVQRKLYAERSAGLYLADISIQGLSSLTGYKDMNILENLSPLLILPEVVDNRVWHEGRMPFADKESNIIYFTASSTGHPAINTDMVKIDEIRFSRDLLNPKWKYKIVMDDPTVAGPAQQNARVMMIRHGADFVRGLVKQQLVITRDARLQAEWVAKGKYPIAIAPKTTVRELKDAGAPIAYQKVEDTMYLSSSSSNIGTFEKVPHPNAVKIFINWLLSREGQTGYNRFSGLHSARVDVDTSYVDLAKMRDAAIKYYNVISVEHDKKARDEYDPLIRDIFAPLMK